MGIKGKLGKATFGINCSLTDATFQSTFQVGSPNNSTAGVTQFSRTCSTNATDCRPRGDFQQITVKPGNRMPGIPLHNINASFAYDITPDWMMGINVVLHSDAFVRGNENNKHKKGPATPVEATCTQLVNVGDTDGDGIDNFDPIKVSCLLQRPDIRYPGKTPGYAVFNFNTAYKITKGLTAALQINNFFDRTYYSAGRLGVNPFSPSIRGAIDPVSGFNYNSNDWLSSTFLAPRRA